MLDDSLFVLTFASALGSGLVGGIFFAFSAFIMRSFDRLPPAQGISAMQSINVAVLNRWFLPLFFGTAVACAALVVSALLGWGDADPAFVLIGSGLYLIGTILVTIAFNVPRNDALAAVEPESPDAADLWATYVPEWTAWNTVRTVAAVAAAASLTIGLVGA